MAFMKRCVSTVLKCACGKPGVVNLKGKWFCVDCSEQNKDPKTPKKKNNT